MDAKVPVRDTSPSSGPEDDSVIVVEDFPKINYNQANPCSKCTFDIAGLSLFVPLLVYLPCPHSYLVVVEQPISRSRLFLLQPIFLHLSILELYFAASQHWSKATDLRG